MYARGVSEDSSMLTQALFAASLKMQVNNVADTIFFFNCSANKINRKTSENYIFEPAVLSPQ